MIITLWCWNEYGSVVLLIYDGMSTNIGSFIHINPKSIIWNWYLKKLLISVKVLTCVNFKLPFNWHIQIETCIGDQWLPTTLESGLLYLRKPFKLESVFFYMGGGIMGYSPWSSAKATTLPSPPPLLAVWRTSSSPTRAWSSVGNNNILPLTSLVGLTLSVSVL